MSDHDREAIWQADYRAYLLRLWRVTAGGRTTWRASLEYAHNGERLGFASLEALCAFLQNETGQNCICDAPAPVQAESPGRDFDQEPF